MRANVPLRDARPAVIVCPHCARHLMEVKDVQWALTRLEFTFACAGCGTEVPRDRRRHRGAAPRSRRLGAAARPADLHLQPGADRRRRADGGAARAYRFSQASSSALISRG